MVAGFFYPAPDTPSDRLPGREIRRIETQGLACPSFDNFVLK
jgi:hypothetical protein